MVWFDVVVGLVLIFALIKGAVNGFVKELASFLALVAGLLGAICLSTPLSGWLSNFWQFKYLGFFVFVILFVGIIIGIHLIAKTLDKMIEGMALGWINRIVGALFSTLKYAFAISVVVGIISFFDKSSILVAPEKQEASYLYEPLSKLAPAVFMHLDFNVPWNEIQGSKREEIMI